MRDDDTLESLLSRWRSGDQAAAHEIYARFESRLRLLAVRQIGPGLRGRVGPDSVVNFVMEAILRGVARGAYAIPRSSQFLDLAYRITKNRVLNRREHFTQGKRDIRREWDRTAEGEMPEPICRDMQAESVAVAEQCDRIRALLPPNLFDVFQMVFEGFSTSEIADRLGCARQTVSRRQRRIRELLARHFDADGAP